MAISFATLIFFLAGVVATACAALPVNGTLLFDSHKLVHDAHIFSALKHSSQDYALCVSPFGEFELRHKFRPIKHGLNLVTRDDVDVNAQWRCFDIGSQLGFTPRKRSNSRRDEQGK